MRKFDFNDINLIPIQCIVKSRSECDTSAYLGDHKFDMPTIPANMSAVITPELAVKLAQNNLFYIMHRFLTNDEIVLFVEMMNKKSLIASISIGVKSTDEYLIKSLCDMNLKLDYITIDVAHGHAIAVKEMIETVRKYFPDVFIIAGNVCTVQGVVDLTQWGADAIKVGIAPGKSCVTAFATGFGSRNMQASTIFECAKRSAVPIIADGGIVHPGDIAKAIVLGATMVMCGSLLTGCKDSPGELKTVDNKLVKEYWGSASQFESGKKNRIEGKMSLIPYKNITLLEQTEYLRECLQSSISYGGGDSLIYLCNVEWI